MDGTTTDPRGLTTTEIPIAVAQIVDRMARLKKAHIELFNYDWENLPSEADDASEAARAEADMVYGDEGDAVTAKIKKKYGIPEGVPLMEEFGDPERHDLESFKKIANKWVRGKFTPSEMADLHADWDCLDEFDFCWVFMGKPAFYYTRDRDKRAEGNANIKEWLELGCRKTPRDTVKHPETL